MNHLALQIKRVESGRDNDQFYELPFEIYHDNPHWIPPFRFEMEKIFNPEENSFFNNGECERFLLLNAEKAVGRFALMTNRKKDLLFDPKMGGIGFIEMVNDAVVAASMIGFAKKWFAERGYGAFRGPVNFGENDNYWGLLVENYDAPPIYGMFYHQPYYKELLEETGAEKYDDQISYKRFFSDPLPERLVKITDRIENRGDVTLRPIDRKHIFRDAGYIKQIYNEAWREQDLEERGQEFTALTDETVKKMVNELKWIMIPDSVLLAFVNGEPASFIVCIPDLNEISAETGGLLKWWHFLKLIRLKKRTTRIRTIVYGTLPKYRKMGLEALTFVRGIQMTKAAAPTVEYLEGAWVSEKNWLMQRSLEALGCFRHKTHRTYRWEVESINGSTVDGGSV